MERSPPLQLVQRNHHQAEHDCTLHRRRQPRARTTSTQPQGAGCGNCGHCGGGLSARGRKRRGRRQCLRRRRCCRGGAWLVTLATESTAEMLPIGLATVHVLFAQAAAVPRVRLARLHIELAGRARIIRTPAEAALHVLVIGFATMLAVMTSLVPSDVIIRRPIEGALVARVCVWAWAKGRSPAEATLQVVTIGPATWNASSAGTIPCEGLRGRRREVAEAAPGRRNLTLDLAWQERLGPTEATLHMFAICGAAWNAANAGLVPCEGRRWKHLELALRAGADNEQARRQEAGERHELTAVKARSPRFLCKMA